MSTTDTHLASAVLQTSYLVQNRLMKDDQKSVMVMMNYIYQLEKNKNANTN